MSVLYLMALVGVGASILWLTWEAVSSAARPVPWQSPTRALTLVRAAERREHSLPFVGNDRRKTADEDAQRADERLVA